MEENTRDIIRNIVKEQLKKKLNESFDTKYENAIDTVEYYLNMCADGHQLSDEQAEQLTEIVEWLKETDAGDNPTTPEWIEAAEELLNQSQPQLQEKKSGIHINPENKGKFTATKKRTGKSTEELTHSKNPLTKKRAVFAQNAKRWAKKKTNEDTEPGQRPSWQEILKRINDAGVNQAIPRRSANPQTQTQPQPEEQPNQVVQQPKQDANGIQIGKYVFNPSQHTLTGPDGVIKLRPQYSNAIEAMCKNLGEDAEISKMFNITDDRSFRVLMSMLRKLFAGDPNVKIIAHGGKANIQVSQEGLNESIEENGDYEQTLFDVVDECGWGIDNFFDVQSKSTGQKGTRFVMHRYAKNACQPEELKQKIAHTIPQEMTVFSSGQNKYAPEMTSFSVVLLDV